MAFSLPRARVRVNKGVGDPTPGSGDPPDPWTSIHRIGSQVENPLVLGFGGLGVWAVSPLLGLVDPYLGTV